MLTFMTVSLGLYSTSFSGNLWHYEVDFTNRGPLWPALNIDPLSEAIMRNQPCAVDHITRAHPALLYRKASFWFASPLHLSLTIGYYVKEITTAILNDQRRSNSNERKLLESLHYFDDPKVEAQIPYPVHYTMWTCGQARDYGLVEFDDRFKMAPILPGESCWYTAQLDLSLRHGALVILPVPQDGVCRHCFSRYATELRLRRNELKTLGLENLPPADIIELGLHTDQVLDRHAKAVVERLHALGVSIPHYLLTNYDEDAQEEDDNIGQMETPYAHLSAFPIYHTQGLEV